VVSRIVREGITLFVEADPLDQTADRTKAKRVPTVFTIRFSPLMDGITRSTLEDLLPLDIGYWVDGDGNRQPGNDMGAIPPQIRLHHYATVLRTSRRADSPWMSNWLSATPTRRICRKTRAKHRC
jgi:hypothetical protein